MKAESLLRKELHEVMTLVGTAEGQNRFPHEIYMQASESGEKRFSFTELKEKYEMKSFFSRTKSEAHAALYKA